MHQTSFGASAWRRVVGRGVWRGRYLRLSTKPFRSSMEPMVLGAGSPCPSWRSSTSFNFFGPQVGCRRPLGQDELHYLERRPVRDVLRCSRLLLQAGSAEPL